MSQVRPETGMQDFDYDRAHVVNWIRVGQKAWTIVCNWATGPELFLTVNIEYRIVPELGDRTNATLVDVVGKGVAARVIIAAENQDKIDRYLDPNHPYYQTPPELF